jgi:hypothetical protein
MLENWIWIPKVLIGLGKHYYTCLSSDHTAKETDETIQNKEGMLLRRLAENVARTKTLNLASDMLTQIQPALFGLAIYTRVNHKQLSVWTPQPCGARRDETFLLTVMEVNGKTWASDRHSSHRLSGSMMRGTLFILYE